MKFNKIIVLMLVLAINACSDNKNNNHKKDTAKTQETSTTQSTIVNEKSNNNTQEISTNQDPAAKNKPAADNNADTVVVGNLIWMRCSVGKVWENNTCKGRGKKYTYKEALEINQPDGFHLPTIEELTSLVVCTDGKNSIDRNNQGCVGDKYKKPTIDKKLFPKTVANSYWSATKNELDVDLGWGIDFKTGAKVIINRIKKTYIRLVKNK